MNKKFIVGIVAFNLIVSIGLNSTSFLNTNIIQNIDVLANETVYIYTGSCGTKATYFFNTESGTLTIIGQGGITSSDGWASYKDKIKTLIIEDGIEYIPQYMFNGYSALQYIEVSSSVNYIGFGAFDNTSFMENYQSEDNFVIFGNGILYKYFGNESSVTIPDGVTYINSLAFEDCTNMQNVYIPNSVETICCFAFLNCTSLNEVTIPKNVENIDILSFGLVYSDKESNNTSNKWQIAYNNKPIIYNKDFIVHGELRSSAEKYASDNDFRFFATDISLGDDIINSGSCGENSTWTMDKDYNVTISGTGAVDLSILAYAQDIEDYIALHPGYSPTLTIEEGITSIDFLQGFKYVKTLELPNSVTTIKKGSLMDLEGLEEITILGRAQILPFDKSIHINFTSLNKNFHALYYNHVIFNFSNTEFSNIIHVEYNYQGDLSNIFAEENSLKTIYSKERTFFKDYASETNIEFVPLTDEKYTYVDALKIKKHILGVYKQSSTRLDINNDGTINILDLLSLKQYLFNN